ncbi:YbhB/YbcL family Raf kinase inhibitor-like protein [Corynebacterium variabile]|uniref:YbhB/YbcL family Raf kinase inhibitor-like protein n=1 Tax=Corynebacterium variabile TaxID=1727 RepID=UPI001D66DB2D|nr:YbhB/YbcL family Raf kinase inhibitor-like protein [Corynebacterium variabile]HJG46764.1 YbhB/YbcL family Raf kinase inhibitor-like protein [Corynebacterium variabile]
MSVPEQKNHQPTYIDDRFPGPDPYGPLTDLLTFTVTSEDITDGGRLAEGQLGGNDISPQLSWSGAPEGTETYAVTCYDPDAPTGAGYWHWAVFNIPASVTSLVAGAGDDELVGLPEGAVALRGDSGRRGFYGAEPPAGHGPHRYIYAVHAVPQRLDIPGRSTPTILGFNLNFTASARALLWGWAEN